MKLTEDICGNCHYKLSGCTATCDGGRTCCTGECTTCGWSMDCANAENMNAASVLRESAGVPTAQV